MADNNATTPYPTRFSNLSDTQLKALFRSDVWFGDENNKGLTLDQKREAMQEIVNRDAAANGMQPAKVTTEVMYGGTIGYQKGGKIAINETLVDRGAYVTVYKDDNGNNQFKEHKAAASNWMCLRNMYHENTHNFQHQKMLNNINSKDPAERAEARAFLANHRNYMRNSELYGIQRLEREATARADEKTKEAIRETDRVYGKDKQSEAFMNNHDNNKIYADRLNAAIAKYNDPDIEKTVDAVMYDRTFGTNRAEHCKSATMVNADIDAAHPGQSYTATKGMDTGEMTGEDMGNITAQISDDAGLDSGIANEYTGSDNQSVSIYTDESGMDSGDTGMGSDDGGMDSGDAGMSA